MAIHVYNITAVPLTNFKCFISLKMLTLSFKNIDTKFNVNCFVLAYSE